MRGKLVITVMVGVALLLSLGAFVKDASADAIMFPWVVRSADVTTVISVINTAETDAEALGLPFHNNRLHIEYWAKLTTANDQEEMCEEYNFEITSSKDDMVTWDIAGHFNGGLPMFNDTSNEVIAATDMTLAVADPRRAFLIVDNNTKALIDSSCQGDIDGVFGDDEDEDGLITGCNKDGTLYGEATIIEHKTGAAWGYIAYNAEHGQRDPFNPGGKDLEFDDGDDNLGEVIDDDETTLTTLLNPNVATTKLFVTPADTDNIDSDDPDDRDQRRGDQNTIIQLCRFPERDSEYTRFRDGILPYTGDCQSGGIWNNEEGGFSFTVEKNIVCTSADEIVDFFGGAGTSAYTQWVASGKAGWAYVLVESGDLDDQAGVPDTEDGNYIEADEAIIGKLEFGTGLNWGGAIEDTINTFVWLRNTGKFCETGGDRRSPAMCSGINIIHNEVAGQALGACCLEEYDDNCVDGRTAQGCNDNDYALTTGWQGADSTCSTASCPILGSCCRSDGSCENYVEEADCQDTSDPIDEVWNEGQSCSSVSCEQPTAACCSVDPLDGSCTDETLADCLAAGDAWFDGWTCTALGSCPD
jgi:hypothetical protein